MKSGVIGLGVIGQEIVRCLHGNSVFVYDREYSLVQKCIEKGVAGASSIAEVSACDIIFICVNGNEQIESVMSGEDGLLEHLTKGKIVVDAGTTSPRLEEMLERLCAAKGAYYLDAPVTWRGDGLVMMVGGNKEAYRKAETHLKTVSTNCRYMGGIGSGQKVKSLNQMIFSNLTAVWSEAVAYADALGITQETMTDFLGFSPPDSMYTGDFTRTKGSIDNNVKDLLYVIELAHERNITIPVTSVTHQAFKYLMKIGDGKLSQNSLIKYWNILNGESES